MAKKRKLKHENREHVHRFKWKPKTEKNHKGENSLYEKYWPNHSLATTDP